MDSKQVKEALELVGNLIQHQYTGSREAMTALQLAGDACAAALSSLQSQQEPIAYQSRFRQFMGGDDSWSGWDNCNKQTYNLYREVPVRNGWEYEVRALVAATPLPQSALSSAQTVQTVRDQAQRVEQLQNMFADMYQAAGELEASKELLDVLSAAMCGEPIPEDVDWITLLQSLASVDAQTVRNEALEEAAKAIKDSGLDQWTMFYHLVRALQSQASAKDGEDARRWKQMAEFQYALRVYPNNLDLGEGALDEYMKGWSWSAAIAQKESGS